MQNTIFLFPFLIPVTFYVLWKAGAHKQVMTPQQLETVNGTAGKMARDILRRFWPLTLLLPLISLPFTMADLNQDPAWRHSQVCDLVIQIYYPVVGMLVAAWLSMVYRFWARAQGREFYVAGLEKTFCLGFFLAFARLLFGFATNIGPFYTPLFLVIAAYPAILFSENYDAATALYRSAKFGSAHLLALALILGRASCWFWLIQLFLAVLVIHFGNLAQFIPSRITFDIQPYSGFFVQTCGQIASLIYDTFVLLNILEYIKTCGPLAEVKAEVLPEA